MLYGLLKQLPDPVARLYTEKKRVALKPAAESLTADGPRQVVFS
jgi:hypothetical protein